MSAAGGDLAALLSQAEWRSTAYGISVVERRGDDANNATAAAATLTAPRVDCKFEWCTAPSGGPYALVDGGDACAGYNASAKLYEGMYVLVSADGCDYEAAALHVFNATAAAGALLIAKPEDGAVLRPVGAYDTAWWGASASTVPRAAGAALAAALARGAALALNFTADEVSGYWLGVTSGGALYQLGWQWMDDLQARRLLLFFFVFFVVVVCCSLLLSFVVVVCLLLLFVVVFVVFVGLVVVLFLLFLRARPSARRYIPTGRPV